MSQAFFSIFSKNNSIKTPEAAFGLIFFYICQQRAKQLLIEEHPATLPFVKRQGPHWHFEGALMGFEDVGRFILGLPGEVKVLEPPELWDYVLEKIEKAYW
jgi:hypothetical protein